MSKCGNAPRRTRTYNPLIKSQTDTISNVQSQQQLTLTAADGCSAGCSYRQGEGGMPPDLARLVAAWPSLPEPIRAAIRALIGSVV